MFNMVYYLYHILGKNQVYAWFLATGFFDVFAGFFEPRAGFGFGTKCK